jgi:hypothetical protein
MFKTSPDIGLHAGTLYHDFFICQLKTVYRYLSSAAAVWADCRYPDIIPISRGNKNAPVASNPRAIVDDPDGIVTTHPTGQAHLTGQAELTNLNKGCKVHLLVLYLLFLSILDYRQTNFERDNK